MHVALGNGPLSDYTQPLAMMQECHRRIEHFLGVLQRVVDDQAGGALDEEHHRALKTALDYFAELAPKHTEDEEHSLFPRLRRLEDAQVRAMLGEVQTLESDHAEAQRAHERIDALGRRWLTDDALTAASVEELARLLGDLRERYQRHIRVEDEHVFPLAGRVLGEDDLTAVGREMRQRRQEDCAG